MGVCSFECTNTEKLLVHTGRLYKPNGSRRLIVWLHGSGDDHAEMLTGQSGAYIPVLQALTQAGYPVVVPACGGIKTWGNDTAQTRVGEAIDYVRTNFGAASAPVILAGLSMGALLGLNWWRNNPTLAVAMMMFYPAVNLVAHHDATGGSTDFSTDINAAYTDLAGYNAAKATHDPAQNAGSYTGLPIKMWHSTTDTALGTSNQAAFAAAVGGSAFVSQSLGASGHPDMTAVSPPQVEAFVNQYRL
jgi:pimeloyl-ACP methyl ester carboxylesterase